MGVVSRIISGYNKQEAEETALKEVEANTGDSLTTPAFTPNTAALIEAVIAGGEGASQVQIRSPLLHDPEHGIRLETPGGSKTLYAPPLPGQVLYPQDKLTVEIGGTAAKDHLVGILQYFADLPGATARLQTWEQVKGRIKNVLGVLCELKGVEATGKYSGKQAITATQNNLRANTDYALLGYTTSEDVDIVGITGPDTGNYRVGGPGATDQRDTSRWFVDLSRYTGTGHIPILNSANHEGTEIDIASVQGHAEPKLTLILAQLE